MSGTSCVAVGTGYYSPAINNTRTACTNKPANSVYTSDGNGTNNCSWSCAAGYYLSGSICSACPIDTYRTTSGATSVSQCLGCSIGQYSVIGSSSCSSCTNKPANSTYTSDGNGTNNCSWTCNPGYYKNGTSCPAPSSGYCSSLNGSTCSGTGVYGATYQVSCSTEMYDTRTDFNLPNPNCGVCSYSSWTPISCNSGNYWNAVRYVTSPEMTGYCQDLNISSYGSCIYCSNPGGKCYSATYIEEENNCKADGSNPPDCDDGWVSIEEWSVPGTYSCGLFNWFTCNCVDGRNTCEKALVCGNNYNCPCGDLSSCPCYDEGCAN